MDICAKFEEIHSRSSRDQQQAIEKSFDGFSVKCLKYSKVRLSEVNTNLRDLCVNKCPTKYINTVCATVLII